MTERVERGGDRQEPGTTGDRVSADGRAEQPSPGPENLAELEAHLQAQIEEAVERRFQSAKDKRWAQLEKQYGELSELQKTLSAEQAQGGGRSESGRSPESGEYLELLENLTNLVLQGAKKGNVHPAAVVQPGGGAPQADLRSEYQVRLQQLRPGDVNGLMELKREFRGKGLEIF
ncbi:MAG: hypothetical protein JXB38_15465 [Anaerolineales bacterium]|nr:hypothetical protein [Anaerolineales bacterium]